MRHKKTIRLFLVALVLTGGFLVLWSAPRKKAAPTRETLDCVQKQEPGSNMGWENLSHQFFSAF